MNTFAFDNLAHAKPNTIPVVFIMGATATGKTDIAALLSEKNPAKLISVDSSLVYRGMDIGTAKPDDDFLKQYPHDLIDIRNPNQTYSAADFCHDAQILITETTKQGMLPILVGGTSFYFSALEKGLPSMPQANDEIRARLDNEANTIGWDNLYRRLKEVDPDSAKRIKPTDSQRIQRALEVNEITGKPVASLNQAEKLIQNPIIKVALVHSDRRYLHQRIRQRFDVMIESGLIAEIENLLSIYDKNCSAFRMIGYRQIIEGLDSGESLDSMIEKSIIATRQLAKRQLTWLRNQSNVLWQNANSNKLPEISHLLTNYLEDWIRFYIK